MTFKQHAPIIVATTILEVEISIFEGSFEAVHKCSRS